MFDNRYVSITGATVTSMTKGTALHKHNLMTATVNNKKVTKVDLKDIGFNSPVDISWLTVASKKYNISDDINDYVVVPVPVITAGIPNRNSQAFSIESLIDFSVDMHCPRYKSFSGSPTFQEHDSEDYELAKGVNLDAILVPIRSYNTAKIVVLSAFCRQKDPKLANAILKGERKSYSMGAVATSFTCSVCRGKLGPAIVRTCKCTGTDFTKLNTYGTIKEGGKLHYLLADDPCFVENSSVSDPADITAVSDVL